MFKFENELYLYLLLLIPVFIVVYWMSRQWRKRAIERFGESALVQRLLPDFSPRIHLAKLTLFLFGFAFTVIALANPQMGSKLEKVERSGIDIVVAIDVSNSMLAEDLQPNRLERAKQLVSRLIEKMKDDRVALVVFAGNAYLQMPLTIDYGSAKQFLSVITPEMVPSQGTSIAGAIEIALQAFDEEEKKHKALIIISDGEDHEEGVLAMAEKARGEGVIIHTLGIGSDEGAPIPVFQNGRKSGHKQDRGGNLVVSKLNPAAMKEVAEAGSGQFFHIRGASGEVKEVLSVLDGIEKRAFEDRVFTDYEDQFQYFIALALLCLLIDLLISERKTGWFRNWSLFGEKS